jgi:CDP-diacylglycerol---glycerol-3-phosphate 3-phosphatidyltransferase
MNFPTSLTLLRIVFVPLLVIFLLAKGHNMDLWAVAVLLAAGFTDLLDGYLARKHGKITTLGILLDPIADKLLTSAAFIALVEVGLAPAWMVIIIVGREIAVSGLRSIASAQGLVLQASELGKAKMTLQVIAIATIILERRYPGLIRWGLFLLWLVVAFALASALEYLRSFRRSLNISVKHQPATSAVVLPASEPEREERDVAAH